MNVDSQPQITFNSSFQRMPFGLAMSQDTFQQKMDMNQCLGTIRLIDDVVVYGQTKAYDQNLYNLMKVARQEGLYYNSDKRVVDQKDINFFGTVFRENGLYPDPNKVDEIKLLSSLNNEAVLQNVLGIIKYTAPFISCLSEERFKVQKDK